MRLRHIGISGTFRILVAGTLNVLDFRFVGQARQIILTILGRRVNQPFATVWDVAAWAREKEPSLDLHSPPRRGE